MKVKSESEVAQSYRTLSNPMDCSPPGSSIHGIFQARVLEWGAIAFSAAMIRACINMLYFQHFYCNVKIRVLIKGCMNIFPGGYSGIWRRQWHPTPVLLPRKSHGWRSLVGCSPWGREESDMTERLHFHFSLSCIGEGNGNPLKCSCLESPRDGGAWWAAIYGVAQSRTRLK